MKKKIYATGLGLAVLVGSLVLGSSFINATPGGVEDPLVSRSYVERRFNELVALIEASGTNAGATTGTIVDTTPINTQAVVNQVLADMASFFGTNATFEPINIPAGQTLIAGEGTEIILRSGQAAAHVPGVDGIVNATIGRDLQNGEDIYTNNLLIIPREDGRGVFAHTDIWLLIRGEFTIQ